MIVRVSVLDNGLPLPDIRHLDRLARLHNHAIALVVQEAPYLVRASGLGRNVALRVC